MEKDKGIFNVEKRKDGSRFLVAKSYGRISAEDLIPLISKIYGRKNIKVSVKNNKKNLESITKSGSGMSLCLTGKQLMYMIYIQRYRDLQSISPTYDEIANRFGVTKITVYECLNQLEKKGAIKKVKFQARSILPLVRV